MILEKPTILQRICEKFVPATLISAVVCLRGKSLFGSLKVKDRKNKRGRYSDIEGIHFQEDENGHLFTAP